MYPLSDVFRLFNLPDRHPIDSFAVGVLHWCRIMSKGLKSTPLADLAPNLPMLLSAAWEKTHIRCHAVENLLDWGAVLESCQTRAFAETVRQTVNIIEFGFKYSTMPKSVARKFFAYERENPGQFECMTILWTAEAFTAHATDRFAWRDFSITKGWPVAIFYPEDHKTETEPSLATSDLDSSESPRAGSSTLLSGQKQAFAQLGLMYRARREKLTAAGMTPRLHGLLLGPSGSGKTHVVRSFASAMNLPIYEQSAASWLPQGSKAEIVSAKKLSRFVQTHAEGIIFIDEVEKPFPADLSTSSTWDRANADELMGLLDAKTGAWEGWTSVLADKLDQSFFIVLAGAWQDAYLQALHVHQLLGGNWSNLSIVDGFLDDNHLPPELLNRVSTNLIEVLPPSQTELSQMIISVQRDLDIPRNVGEAQRVAREIVEDRKGMRGVEEYMLRAWMKRNSSAPTPPPTSENLEFDF